ncbi:MAG: VOC family protein [Pseudomonadota bacterium]
MIEISAMFPVLVAGNLDQLKAFYATHFGFEAVFFDPEFYLHLLHPQSGVQLGFLLPEHASQPSFLHARAVADGMVISFEVSDAQAAYNAAQSANLDIAMAFKEEVWGQHHFMVRDPQGFVIDVVQHIEQSE